VWTTGRVRSGEVRPCTGSGQDLPPQLAFRYVRVQGTARATAYGYSLYELQVITP